MALKTKTIVPLLSFNGKTIWTKITILLLKEKLGQKSPEVNHFRKDLKFVGQREKNKSQSYQTLFLFVFLFSLLSLNVCNIRKNCVLYEIAMFNSKKWNNYALMRKKIGRIDY